MEFYHILVTVTGVVSYKASHALRPFLYIVRRDMSSNRPDSSTSAFCSQQRHQVVKQGVGEKCPCI
jgi:hypothetical protein